MNTDQNEIYYKKEKTLRAAWMISLLGPFVTTYAFLVSQSATIFADLLRRTTELLSLFFSWFIFKKVNKTSITKPIYYSDKLENLSGLFISIVMFFSFGLIIVNTINEFADPKEVGWILPGLVIALFGVIINGYFWKRHRSLAKEESTPILEAQWQLYRSKTVVDSSVVITLVSSEIFTPYEWHLYIDPVGSIVVAIFVLASAIKVFKETITSLFF